MAFSEDIFIPDNQCEICGAELSDEVVIQEFADGSIARLCAECAAGAALQADGDTFHFPDPGDTTGDCDMEADDEPDLDFPESVVAGAAAGPAAPAAPAARAPQPAAAEPDAMEKTRELLTPVVDLITLQTEMQGALQRLAASLETFATGVISDNLDKTATVESRLESLERELESTRARLRETEALLAGGATAVAPAVAAAPSPPAAQEARRARVKKAASATPPAAAPAAGAAAAPAARAASSAAAASFWDFDSTAESTADLSLGDAEGFPGPETPAAAAPAQEPASDTDTQPYSLGDLQSTMPPAAPPVAPQPVAPPVAPPAGPATAEHPNRPTFALAEVQLAQKYFNESQFTSRVRDVRKSLGKPKANLTKVVGGEPRALVTVAWDIIWYQYLVDLRRDIPTDQRVTLHREGMDLDELTAVFREKNASLDDEGRLDASELEVKLLSDPSTLITEMSVDEERALEDATEEIWDQRTAPEFKWDD
jgi:hypothetical protein